MNTILLHPTDVLFFRDGRPMNGSLAGHGAAWPMPTVINAAFHAALHRSGLGQDAHSHRRGARGVYAEGADRDRKFGSLVTAGPFPVRNRDTWFFSRPLDLQDASLQPALLPSNAGDPSQSSLPAPLAYAVASRIKPTKGNQAKGWLTRAAYERYLNGSEPVLKDGESLNDADFSDTEHAIGIAIDPATGTTGQGEAAGKIYSAFYLRLREGWQLGVCATAWDKEFDHAQHGKDLVRALLHGGQHQIIVGGQQRVCSASIIGSDTPLPRGKPSAFCEHHGKSLVKWILLSPAVWPVIEPDPSRGIKTHPGGWLPNWIDSQTGRVLLKAGDVSRLPSEDREAWRRRIRQQESIGARLVAALVPKPLAITGWALPDEASDREAERQGGALSCHLAVPAGAVYYFEADSPADAEHLAAALNWHGPTNQSAIRMTRRSTLLGEKGFGLGVCGTWRPHHEA